MTERPQAEPDRHEIAARHGIPQMAHQIIGSTPEAMEADATARAAVLQMVGGTLTYPDSPTSRRQSA